MAKQLSIFGLRLPILLCAVANVAIVGTFLASLHGTPDLSSEATPNVPLLSIALSSDPLRYLPRLLLSIDHEIDTILVHVGNDDPRIVEDIESGIFAAMEINSRYLQGRLRLTRSSFNPGAAGGTNIGLRAIAEETAPDYSWGMVANSDIEFRKGSLARLAQRMAHALAHQPRLGVAFLNLHPLATWSAYAATRAMVRDVGLQDENFYPAYFEDDDYSKRLRLAGWEAVKFKDVGVAHGDQRDGSADYVSGTSLGMRAMPARSNATAWAQSKRGWDANQHYMQLKWGLRDMQPDRSCKQANEINTCNVTYRRPFNDNACTLSQWRASRSRRNWIVSGTGALPLLRPKCAHQARISNRPF
jgi:hypothetical protein